MLKTLRYILCCHVVLVFLFSSCDGARMRQELNRIDSLNMARVNLDTITKMDEVVRYFDNYGTSNERMLAHYLHGRVAADRNDIPRALRYYRDAVACADTTESDCNYAKMSRIYGQMATLFHQQRAPRLELDAEQKAVYYAWKAKDTLAAISFYSHLTDPYDQLNMIDSAMYYSENARKMYLAIGRTDYAANLLAYISAQHIDQGFYEQGKKEMDEAEQYGSVFDQDGYILPGKEIYYYYKGAYYENTGKLDSAEYFYRKLQCSQSDDRQEGASHGLMSVYHRKGNVDSVRKYSLLYTQAVDSSWIRHSSDEIIRTQALYNYGQSEREAFEKTKEKLRYQKLSLCLILLMVVASYVGYVLYSKQKKRTKEQLTRINSRYVGILSEFEKTTGELSQLKQNIDVFREQKENESAALQRQLNDYISAGMLSNQWEKESEIINAPIIKEMHGLASRVVKPTSEQWVAFRKYAEHTMPTCVDFIMNNPLTYQERLICLLIRFQFIPSEQAALLGVSKQRITNLRAHINEVLFGQKGTSTLNENIMKI